METVVELEGVNGEWFTLAGPNEGDRGVHLGTGVEGLYDPPVKAVYEEPGNYPGARYLNHRILRRDITFGVEILNDKSKGSWMTRDSEWRKAWSFKKDCKLYITTEESGRRYLKLRLLESPDVSLFTDPNKNTVNRVAMTCVAGDPFWYEDDVVYEAITAEDTTFDPSPLPWPWPQDPLPTETLTINVDPSDGKGGLNPTDQPVFLKWSIPGSTLPPAEPYVPGIPWLGAPKSPATIWTLPDYSFGDEEQDPDLEKTNRRIRMPGLIGGLRTECVQAVYIDGHPTTGGFYLTLYDETTGLIPYNATNSQVKAALEALSHVAFDDVQVTRAAATNEVQVIKLVGGPTGGFWKLNFDGQPTADIPFNANEGTVRNALIALPNVGNLDVSVVAHTVNEVQTVQLIGEPTQGTFTLTFDGRTTDPIPWDASAFTVATALRNLPNIDYFDISVTKPSGSYQPWRITFGSAFLGLFGGSYSGIDLQPLTADPSGLSGGAGIDIEIESEVQGARVYAVTFQGALGGLNFPTMTATDTLTGGVDPHVEINTSVDGSRPYLVTFTGNLSGVDVPLMSGTASGFDVRCAMKTQGATAPSENCIVDADPRVEQVSSESGSQVWARMNGVRFRHYVPPYTESKSFEITVSGCEPGQMVTLRIPRPWTRPWGLE